MDSLHTLLIWPENPLLSLLVVIFAAIPILYGARQAMHSLLQALFRGISNPLRLLSHWLFKTADTLQERNKIVLLSRGREEVSHGIAKEFERVTNLVQRDLHGYPALQRKLTDEITRIEEEFQKCGEVPPPPPEWTKAVAAIAKIKPSSDGLVERILDDISTSIDEIYEKVVAEYRESYKKRHDILKGFMPFWRSVDQTLKRVDKNLTGMQESAAKIDEQVEKYKQIHAKSDQVEHSLASSSTILFVISLLAITIAAGGAFVNFWLIERPMAAMVGGSEYIVGDIQASYLAAMVIIFFETLMGLFLMESLGYTHLFPLNGINNRMRRWLVWISFGILLILAGVEVALAVMRDMIISADIALKQELAGGSAVKAAVASTWALDIPKAAQMILGFTLPFALAFVAIPLEYLIHSGRTVFGVLLVLGIRGLGFATRFLSSMTRQIGKGMEHLYDAVIFLPLIIEHAVLNRGSRQTTSPGGSGKISSFSKHSAGEHVL
ncbi:MAG: hypothetical protein HY274_03525 [Gammaproteobacteria bacterium]|nr:hypothetical protein [Gammaproteobacteria bacterium]